ncbi:hypothetical protein EJ02DRAFT_426279 [Clathrospora elynae]|uniref:Uncharacterized protein n=1 Tax=Clathrospora elynae TaxID=706981 RepID=A0A6A5SDQ6_9PLEO|nr:hypothetical protein EJ02DRAFT_426279 [Clathrospora elynae]
MRRWPKIGWLGGGWELYSKVPIDASDEAFALLFRKISHQALRMMKNQLNLAFANNYNNTSACSGAFTAKYGLPCKHFIHDKTLELCKFKKNDKLVFYIKLIHVDQHWWLEPPRAKGEVFEGDDTLFRPLDPLKVKNKGRPKGATTKKLPRLRNGNHLPHEPRSPSGFEHALVTQVTTSALSLAPPAKRKRSYKKKVMTITEVEEVESSQPASELATVAHLRELQDQMTGFQEEIKHLRASMQGNEAIVISSDEDSSSNKAEDEHRSSDVDFNTPGPPTKHVQPLELPPRAPSTCHGRGTHSGWTTRGI